MKFSDVFIRAFLDALLIACWGNRDFSSPAFIEPPGTKPDSQPHGEAGMHPAHKGVAPAGANLYPVVYGVERSPGSSAFGAVLRRHRLAAGLSQEALAERARMSTHGISALERGYRRTPQRKTLALLAGALALNGDEHAQFQLAARSVRRASAVSDARSLSAETSIEKSLVFGTAG